MNYDEEGRYLGPRKRVAHKRGNPPRTLACICLRDGTLDVDIETGTPVSYAKSKAGKPIKATPDRDGYLTFYLCREMNGRWIRKKDNQGRRRWKSQVRVHRLVKMKAVAVGLATEAGKPKEWREYVRDLPPAFDVDHADGDRANNSIQNLQLLSEGTNRGGREMTPGEATAAENHRNGNDDLPF